MPENILNNAAPEQYGFGQSDMRTDIYGLGAAISSIVYRLHCGMAITLISGINSQAWVIKIEVG